MACAINRTGGGNPSQPATELQQQEQTMTVLSFPHPLLSRDTFIASTREHRKADRIAHTGYGFDRSQRGCAIGCAIETINKKTGSKFSHSDHIAVAESLGIPVELAQLEDVIFESLSRAISLDWPVRFAETIPDRADLSGVWPAFASWMLRDICLPALGKDDEGQAVAVRRVANGMETGWAQDDRAAAGAAARAAAWAAAWAAVKAVAGADTWAAARTAAWDAARDAAWAKMADKLCELIAAAPVVPNN